MAEISARRNRKFSPHIQKELRGKTIREIDVLISSRGGGWNAAPQASIITSKDGQWTGREDQGSKLCRPLASPFL
jgi:hypothetical protein